MPNVKNFDTPDDTRVVPNATMAIVTVGNATVTRSRMEPGWRWSADVAPIAGTDSCRAEHLTYVVSGRMHIRLDDGTEYELSAGEVGSVPPGHDAWVVGEEPVVGVDFVGGPAFADATNPQARTVACPCGVSFHVHSAAALDHLVDAVQQHAAASHGHDVTRAHVLQDLEHAR